LAVNPVEAGVSNFALKDDAVASIMGETKLYRLDIPERTDWFV